MNSATPMETGVAISSAMAEAMSVPMMMGQI
jgi:hypothetical protein